MSRPQTFGQVAGGLGSTLCIPWSRRQKSSRDIFTGGNLKPARRDRLVHPFGPTPKEAQ